MAPVQRPAAASPTNHIDIRHYSHCSGWYCFTSAEQAGIIISAVTVTMVALFAWMYVLGRITMTRKQEALQRGGRQQHRSLTQRGSLPLYQLPQVPLYPSSSITYVPVSYTQPGILAVQTPTQVHPLMTPQQPVCMIIPVEPMTYSHPHPIHHSSDYRGNHLNDSALHHVSSQASVSSSYDPIPRQPTWVQRVYRAFGLPVGRASTVDTNSTLEARTSLEARLDLSLGDAQPSHLEPSTESDHGAAHNDQEHQENGDLTNTYSGGNDIHPEDVSRIQSPVSIAATVHSDDYDTISNPNAAGNDIRQTPSGSSPGGNSPATDSTAVSENHTFLVSISGPPVSNPGKRSHTSTPDGATGRQHTGHQQYSAPMIRHGNGVSTVYPGGVEQYHARGREAKRCALDYTFGSLAERLESNTGPLAPQPTHQRRR